jgi:hypothetical protein
MSFDALILQIFQFNDVTSFDVDISGFVRSSAQAAVKADKNTNEILDSYRTNTHRGTGQIESETQTHTKR